MSLFQVEIVPAQHRVINHKIVAGGMLVHPATGRIVDYAQAVHDGHYTKGGTWVAPNPFITDAINIHINELYQIIDSAIDKSINTVWVGGGSPSESGVPVTPNSFVGMGETDFGTKGSAKKACKKLPDAISAEIRGKMMAWWNKVKQTAQALCPVDYGILQATVRVEPL